MDEPRIRADCCRCARHYANRGPGLSTPHRPHRQAARADARRLRGARLGGGAVSVLEEGAVIAGIIVLLPMADYLLLDNIAISPARQGLGLGRRLLAFAEAEALRRGYNEIRLYTQQTMVENQRLYASIGYEETGRGTEAGYDRVFMRKQLRR
jgi:ribosomal protein S18 acetylase RimI-like enzyme